jgi:hypothetical protein
MLGLISEGLLARGVGHVTLTRQTADRQKPIAAFQSRRSAVFLISHKAGGAGLHPTGADPAIPDQTFRRIDSENFNLVPGGKFIYTETFRQADATLQIRSTYHLIMVDGEPTVEHFVGFVRGCP